MFKHLSTAAPDNRQDQLVWKMLFDRQTALLHRRAAPVFSAGLARLGLRRETIPDIGELGRTVYEQSGWQLAPVGRPFDPPAWEGRVTRNSQQCNARAGGGQGERGSPQASH